MEIIIDIPEEIYKSSKKECAENDSLIIDTFTLAIGNGKPLPEPQYWVYKKGKGWFCPDCDKVGDEHFNYCPYCATPLKLQGERR